MPVATLVLTTGPNGHTILVTMRNTNGTLGPARKIPVDQGGRLAAFVAAIEAIARQQLAPIEPSAVGRAGDGDPSIAVDAVHGEHGRWWP